MEYQIYLWKDPQEREHLLVRTHSIYGGILQGRVFKKYIYDRFGHDETISLIIDDNNVNSALVQGIPLLLNDEYLNDLEWENYRWGEIRDEEE